MLTDDPNAPSFLQPVLKKFEQFENAVEKHAGASRTWFKLCLPDHVDLYMVLHAAVISVIEEGLTSITNPTNVGVAARIGLSGQVVLTLGSTYDSISQGFYGVGTSGLRRIYEHLVHMSAWRLNPDEMQVLRIESRGGSRQAYSQGKIQQLAETHSLWRTHYGELSRLTHPEGLFDELHLDPSDDPQRPAFRLEPVFHEDVARTSTETLISLVVWLLQEVDELVKDVGGDQTRLREAHAAAGLALNYAEEKGILERVNRD